MKRGLVTGGSGKGELADFFQDFKYVLNVSRKEQDKQKWLKMTETDRQGENWNQSSRGYGKKLGPEEGYLVF